VIEDFVSQVLEEWYLWLLGFFAVVFTVLAWRVPRAPAWVAMGALSFLSSGWWHDAGFDYGEVYGAFTNFLIIAALFAYGPLLYELVFMGCFIVMVVIDYLYLTNRFNSHHNFAIGLELANWLALLSIGAAGMAERAGVGLAWVSVFRAPHSRAGSLHLGSDYPVVHLAGEPKAKAAPKA
jgi:hypothetical protein